MMKKEVNSSRIPVYRDAGFELFDAAITADTFAGETENTRAPGRYIYSRYRNPSVVSAEEEIMKLERCNWALLSQSGMSAIDIALSVFQNGKKTGPWLFFTEIYGGTISFVEAILRKRRGLDIHYFAPDKEGYNLVELEKSVSALKPELVYIESVSNPMLIVSDVTEIARIVKRNGAKLIIDNTFATPWLYRPLEDGADIVIHSATKYLSGHGNLTAGVICGNDEKILRSAVEYRKFAGHMLAPDDAYRLQTQVQTFELRFPRQCSNAEKLATFLERSSLINRVLYPGLKNHPTHNVAENQFMGKGFGAMITFDFDGSDDNEKRSRRDHFISLVSEKIKLIPTLGDPHTILMPVEAVWGAKYPEPGMIRLSVGFEIYEELLTTIDKALKTIEKT